MKKLNIIKTVSLSLVVCSSILWGWEINTHRAIDRCAIVKDEVCGRGDVAKNLHWFAKNSNIINNEDYTDQIFKGYTTNAYVFPKKITYFDYVTKGEPYGISSWGQSFSNHNYVNLIEAGTILEDALWGKVNQHVFLTSKNPKNGDGRFNFHFYDSQDKKHPGAGLSIKMGYRNENAIDWAENGGSGFLYDVTKFNYFSPDIYKNNYSYDKALQYFRDGFILPDIKMRKENRAKMFVSLGYLLHLLNDMNVPAHTRDDAHPLGDPLEVWMRGGDKGSDAGGFKMVEHTIDLNNNSEIMTAVKNTKPFLYNKASSFRDFYKKEAEFTGKNFFSEDSILVGFGLTGYIGYSPKDSDVILVDAKEKGLKYIQSTSEKLITGHNVLAMFNKSSIWDIDGASMMFGNDTRALVDNGINLIPRAVANAEGFVNYFFRGRIQAIIDNGTLKIANVSDSSLVASEDAVTFREGGSFSIYYDNKKTGERYPLTNFNLTTDLKKNQIVSYDISEKLAELNDKQKEYLTVVYDLGNIGSEPGVAVTTIDETKDSDNDGMPDVYELKYSRPFILNTKDFKYLDPNKNDADEDIDGDGVSNYQEYKDGTHPFNNQSKLSLELETAITESKVKLTWNEIKSATKYKVCVAKEPIGDNANLCMNLLDGGKEYTISSDEKRELELNNLALGTPYYMNVRAFDGTREVHASVEKIVSLDVVPILVIPTLRIESTTEALNLSWDEISNASFYKICKSTKPIDEDTACNGDTETTFGTTTTTKELTEEDDIEVGKTYYFRVKPVHDDDISHWSDEVSGAIKDIPIIQKVIKGTTKDSSENPISGINVKFEYLVEGEEKSTTAVTDSDGNYEIKVDSSYFKSTDTTYLIYAYKDGYIPETKTLKIGAENSYGIDFVINPIKENEVVLEIEPKIHHLGDDDFGTASINSQFQKKTEGTEFIKEFEISSEQYANYSKAVLKFEAKGIQDYGNTLTINDKTYTLSSSPSDGSYGTYRIELEKSVYYEGSNSLKIKSGYSGDYDDFEFSNIVLEFEGLIESSDTLQDALVAHYKFEEQNGATILKDSSDNHNDGEIHGVKFVNGVVGERAGSFDGVDDYILVPDSSSFPTNAITLSYWINRDSIPSQLNNYISKELSFQSYLTSDGHFESGLWKGSAGQWSGYLANSNISNNLNKWMLYTITFDNNSKEAKSFINATLVNTTTETDVNAYLRDSSNPMYIGRNGSQSVYFIKSKLDDLRIYDRALSESEIKELYEMGNQQKIEGKYLKLLTPPSKNKELTFTYNYDGDSCSINFHDGTSELQLDSCTGSSKHTFTNKENVYFVELKSNGERIDNIGVPIENTDEKWIGFVSSLDSYLEENENYNDIVKDGRIYLSPSLSDNSYYWTNYRFIKPSILNELDGDNCIIESRVKVPYSEGGIGAYDINLGILGSSGYSGWVTFMGDSWGQGWDSIGAVNSYDTGLSQLVRNFSDWKVIKLEIKNQEVKAYYEGNLVYTKPYEGKLGKIYGIRQSFKGSGSIDWVKLYNGDGKLIYSEDFN